MNLIIQLRRGASGLGVELDVKNKVVGLITGGQAEADGLVKINDAVVAVDGVVLGAKRLPEVLAPGRPLYELRVRRDDPLVDEKGYPSYNKPYSVMSWLAATKINEDYVLMLDADMVMRQPIEPTSLGARRGNVVSAEYTYLYGTTNGFTERFIPKKLQRRLAQVGGFHIFHRDDLAVIAPLWIEYTRRARAFARRVPSTRSLDAFPRTRARVVSSPHLPHLVVDEVTHHPSSSH